MFTNIDTPSEIRASIREEKWKDLTSGLAPRYTQANLVILPKEQAFDFLRFCLANPKPCPLIEVTDPGSPEPIQTARGADLRVDVPRYRVYRDGNLVAEPFNILPYWQENLVSFLLGCSFTFEQALLESGIPVRGLEENGKFSAYITNIACTPIGIFHGPLVVTMRPMTPTQAIKAVQITSRFSWSHGAPIHIGDPNEIGISTLTKPDYGEPVEILPGEIPVFWACGITPQAVALESSVELMITHSPGHMFITDVTNDELLLR